jgi:hypothetical protein
MKKKAARHKNPDAARTNPKRNMAQALKDATEESEWEDELDSEDGMDAANDVMDEHELLSERGIRDRWRHPRRHDWRGGRSFGRDFEGLVEQGIRVMLDMLTAASGLPVGLGAILPFLNLAALRDPQFDSRWDEKRIAFSVEILSTRPARAHVYLIGHKYEEFRVLPLHPIKGNYGAIKKVSLKILRRHAMLKVEIPPRQHGGTYRGAVIDTYTHTRCGTVTVHVL